MTSPSSKFQKLCSLLLPFFAACATVHESADREIGQHDHVYMEVDSAGSARTRQEGMKHLELRPEGASLAELETKHRLMRSRYLPQYPTGPATCDGTQLPCPTDASIDPCSTLQNCSSGGFHDCSGSFKICLPNRETDKCESGDDCLLRCTGVFAEETDGSLKKCKELTSDKCNGYYAADPDYANNGIGYECGLKEDRTCAVKGSCGVQNPPESLGEKQCTAPEVFKGAYNGTCQTKRIRPGKECTTNCQKGFTPSLKTLKCVEGGTLEPKSFNCNANPCKVLEVENALKSGCKEGPDTGEAIIESGLACTTQCQDGFYQSDKMLRCHAETLTPATFTCEAPCTVPTVSNSATGGICKEAKDKIMPFTTCSTQCAAGYTATATSLSCRNGAFSPATVQCTPDPCPAPTAVEFHHKKGPCQDGSTITSGSPCVAQCLAGYTPSVSSLACNAGTLTPATFQCVPNPCTIPDVKNSAGSGCDGIKGDKVDSGKACKTSCKKGYTPSEKKMDCYAQVLSPRTFECLEDPCPIPFAKNQEGSGCVGVPGRVDGTVIESGDTCRTECKEGYYASVESMSCTTGTLSPASWSCIEDPCPALEGIANAPKVTCKEGKSIESTKVCTTLCKSGYTPNYPSMTCRRGKFFRPRTYICEPDACPLPKVQNRLESGCSGLPDPAVVNSGSSCSTQCAPGYSPSVDSLKCFAGKLTPGTFACKEDPCDAPSGIENGKAGGCKEGKSIGSGDSCTAQCAAGYTPSKSLLSCSLGTLTPNTYSCNPDPCALPRVSARKGNGCRGKTGTHIDSGATCTLECLPGYTPSETSLKCSAAVLTPKTYTCDPDPCPLPSVNKAQGNGCKGAGGSMLESGAKCKAECTDGYSPSVAELSCTASVLTPATFTCNPNACKLPRVQNQVGNGCQGKRGNTIASGTTCQTQCASGYTPDIATLSCFAEILTPSTFLCNPTPCTLPRVSNSQGNGCKGKVGTEIASGATCSTTCGPGFEASAAKLTCTAGTLSPATFTCSEVRCRSPTGLPHAPHVGCAEGSTIAGGRSCTPRCNSGYTPSVASMACRQGVFEPNSFSCLPSPCNVPGISNAMNPRCKEGNIIQHGQKCNPQCRTNFIPSKSGLTCMAGRLTPSTFACQAPCAAPAVRDANQPCKEGRLIKHGGSCSSQCNAGYSATSGSLECNNGRLSGSVSCRIEMPAVGSRFYNCWSGDPHFTCRHGRRSDPLVPGTHWVLKQACPASPNFMWVQGVYGPAHPSGAMATAFGGMFLGKNVLTIRANSNPPWVVKWNDRPVERMWRSVGGRRRRQGKFRYNLAGTMLGLSMHGNHLHVVLGYGVSYKATRHRWNRQNWKVSGIWYTDYYMSNQLWSALCRGGRFGGEAIDLPHPRWLWRPRGDDRMVSRGVDLFQNNKATIENKLNSLTGMASLYEDEDGEIVESNATENVSMDANITFTDAECTGKALEEAKKSCAVLKKEDSEEAEEEIEEDKEAKENQESTYQACIADACNTGKKDFGDAGKEVEEESEMQTALKHKKEFRVVAANTQCKEGWMLTDPNENILAPEEKKRAQTKKDACKTACQLCRPKHRRYLVGPTVLHNETREACVAQRLAMPKYPEDVKRLSVIQKEHCQEDKAWLGGKFKGGAWKWDDDTSVTGVTDGKEGDYLCIDKEQGTLVNCAHGPEDKNDALCEGVWY